MRVLANSTFQMNNLLHHSKGFTLIECLILAAIIAILVAMATPNFQCCGRPTLEYTQKRQCLSNCRVLASAIELYNLDHTSKMNTIDIKTLLQFHYIRNEIKCPKNASNTYYLMYTSPLQNKEVFVGCSEHGTPFDMAAIKNKIEPIKYSEFELKAYRDIIKKERKKGLKKVCSVVSLFTLFIILVGIFTKMPQKVRIQH